MCSAARLLALLATLGALLCVTRVAAQATDPTKVKIPRNPNVYVNPVVKPVLQNASYVHTRAFAQLPDEADLPAKIVSMQQHGPFLYVCTMYSLSLIHI